ncbi:MAG: glycosyl transferase [Clostridia bacterium]|nr:glycosyl transferase [Clostridia bacterium]
MSNKSVFYKLRRKGQIFAYRLTNPVFVSRLYFRHELGYTLNLDNPVTFNEKLQWLKLFYWPENEKAIQCADKYAVRSYIENMGKAEILNNLIGVWDDAKKIDWDALPQKFALKCNHGCAYNLICQNKDELDGKKTIKQFDKWMHEDFGEYNAEPHYDKIPKRIICEELLKGEIINYNIYVFNGKVVFFSVAGGLGDGVGEHLTYYNADGSLASFKNKNYPVREEKLTELLPQMQEMAVFLAGDFPMVRVDLFDVGGKIIFSEMTFTPGGGLIPFDSYEADKWLGDQLDISKEMTSVLKR